MWAWCEVIGKEHNSKAGVGECAGLMRWVLRG